MRLANLWTPTPKALSWNETQPILSLQIDITNACNLACAHCYHSDHLNTGALKFEQWKDVLVQYEELLRTLRRRPSLIICGGEPLTNPFLTPLLDWIGERFGRIPVTLLTNGTIFKESVTQSLLRHEAYVQVSIDGADAESHNSVRGPKTFERATMGIAHYQSFGLPVSLLAILSKRTSLAIPDFFEMAKSLRVNRMKFTRLVPEGAGANLVAKNIDRALEPLELKTAYSDILKYSRESGIQTNANKSLFTLIDSRLGEHEQFGFNGIVIDYKGNMKLSSRLPILLGNILDGDSMKSTFLNHPLFRDLRQRKNFECSSCQFFRRCGGSVNAAWAATGDLFKKDPGCWIELRRTV